MESGILDEEALMPAPGSRTEQQYQRHVRRLTMWYEQETGREWRDDPIAFARFIVDHQGEWKPGTWRTYRTALTRFLRQSGPVEAVRVLDDTRFSENGVKRHDRGDRSARRGVDTEALDRVLVELGENGRDLALLAALWLITVRITGMRPVECFGAYFHDETTLMVPTAKRYDREYRYYRKLDMTEVVSRPPLGEAISLFLKELRRTVAECTSDNPCFAIQQRCRMQIQRASRKVNTGSDAAVNFRDARHQFSADQQSMQDVIDEVSAALGHSEIITTMRYYSSASAEEDWPRVQATERLLLQERAVDDDDLDIEDDELDDTD